MLGEMRHTRSKGWHRGWEKLSHRVCLHLTPLSLPCGSEFPPGAGYLLLQNISCSTGLWVADFSALDCQRKSFIRMSMASVVLKMSRVPRLGDECLHPRNRLSSPALQHSTAQLHHPWFLKPTKQSYDVYFCSSGV